MLVERGERLRETSEVVYLCGAFDVLGVASDESGVGGGVARGGHLERRVVGWLRSSNGLQSGCVWIVGACSMSHEQRGLLFLLLQLLSCAKCRLAGHDDDAVMRRPSRVSPHVQGTDVDVIPRSPWLSPAHQPHSRSDPDRRPESRRLDRWIYDRQETHRALPPVAFFVG